MKKSPSPSTPRRRSLSTAAGFTLVELMVAIAILALILVFVGQIAAGTSSSISRTSRNIVISSMANNALDRIGSTLAGMVTTGSGTMVVIKNANLNNDAIAFLSNSRSSSRSSVPPASLRMSALGFGVVKCTDYDVTTSPAPVIPMLAWGNGALVFNGGGSGSSGGQLQPSAALQNAVSDMALHNNNGVGNSFLQFQPLGSGIFKFQVCFLISDGSLRCGYILPPGATTAVPCNKNYLPSVPPAPPVTTPTYSPTGASPKFALAFKPVDSNDTTNSTYVRAIIVGIAVIDPTTQNQLTPAQLQVTLPNAFPKVTQDQTPLQAWDFSQGTGTVYNSLKTNFSTKPAVLQYTRIYQRYFYIN